MANFKKVCVIGLGLMGGSLFKALQERGIEIVEDGEAELTIIATPLSAIVATASKLKAPLVIDIGSIKGEIVKEFEKLTSDTQEFIATHPMAGSEKSGYAHSRSDLFHAAPWIITLHRKNSAEGLNKIKALITLLGAKALVMDANVHDERVALISQLPHRLSVMLFEFVKQSDPEALEMAGPGFKSMTRLAEDNLQMREEMRQMNENAFQKCLQEFYAYYTFRN